MVKPKSLEKVLTLELGAEDYITKPFDEAELFARIRVILRRLGTSVGALQDLLIGNARLRVERRALERQGEIIPLTEQEFHLLLTFLRHPQEVLGREMLARDSGSQPLAAGQRHIDVAVGKLRQKLGTGSIVAVRGLGYQLALPVSSPPGRAPRGRRVTAGGAPALPPQALRRPRSRLGIQLTLRPYVQARRAALPSLYFPWPPGRRGILRYLQCLHRGSPTPSSRAASALAMPRPRVL